jgi:hypothetical protein
LRFCLVGFGHLARYETDFKKDGKRNLADKGDAAQKADAKPETKAAEAKPAAAPAAAATTKSGD